MGSKLPALIGFLYSISGTLTSLMSNLATIFVETFVVDNKLRQPIDYFLWHNCKRSKVGIKQYYGMYLYVKKMKEFQLSALEDSSNDVHNLFWFGLIPIILVKDADKSFTRILFIKGSIKIDDFLWNCLENFNEKRTEKKSQMSNNRSRFKIQYILGSNVSRSLKVEAQKNEKELNSGGGYSDSEHLEDFNLFMHRVVGWNPEEIGLEDVVAKKSLDTLYINNTAQEFIDDVNNWIEHREWHIEKDIPWKRGYLLYGRPGTGKTCIVRALGQDLDLPIYAFDLGSLTNEELFNHWINMDEDTPCIALFEDIDTVFKGRENISRGNAAESVTFDIFLQCLDGIKECSGLLVFLTTNNIESVDLALGAGEEAIKTGVSSRPGRIDRLYDFGLLDETGKDFLARRFLEDEEAIQEVISTSGDMTPVQFRELCRSKVAWDNNPLGDRADLNADYSEDYAKEEESTEESVESSSNEEDVPLDDDYDDSNDLIT